MKASLFVVLFALLPFTSAAPEETVLTPAGFRPKSSVIQIPRAGSINLTESEIHLLDAYQNVVHVSSRSTTKVRTKQGTAPELSGWVSYAYWRRTKAPIKSFLTEWTVPPYPSTYNEQTIFLFNGLEPDTGTAILQPVLQFGPSAAGGGAYWAVANWYVSDGGPTYWSTLESVSPGLRLVGSIEMASQNAVGTFNYVSRFASFAESSITLNNSPELPWAFETLETYGVTTSTDYPKGCTVFSGINVTMSSGAVSWSIVSDPSDGINAFVNNNGDISICYPQ